MQKTSLKVQYSYSTKKIMDYIFNVKIHFKTVEIPPILVPGFDLSFRQIQRFSHLSPISNAEIFLFEETFL